MAFCTYLFKDPKTQAWCYVGKGVEARPRRHLQNSKRAHLQLRRMIQKRMAEGYQVEPVIIPAASEQDAFEMEMLLIAMIGRLDCGTGTLFNHTDGGEGTSGRKATQEEKNKRAATMAAKSKNERDEIHRRIQSKRKATLATSTAYIDGLKKMAISRSKPCTIDGITIFPSKNALIAALGQSKSGLRSPTFRYC